MRHVVLIQSLRIDSHKNNNNLPFRVAHIRKLIRVNILKNNPEKFTDLSINTLIKNIL